MFVFEYVKEKYNARSQKTSDKQSKPNRNGKQARDVFCPLHKDKLRHNVCVADHVGASYIDVLFDITSVVLRRDTEEIYVSLMQKLSRSIIEAYEKNEDFQSIIIRNVLELMDTAGNGKFSAKLVSLYDDGSAEEFSSMLKKTINQILYKFNGSELGEEDYNRIFNYIWKIK